MIYARSPYIVHVDDAGLEDIEFTLYIYSGTKDTDKATGDTYTFAIDAINGEVTFDIAPYIRDYIRSLDTLSPTTNGRWCWVTTEIDKDTGAGLSGTPTTWEATQNGCLGYTEHNDGVNYSTLSNYLYTDADALPNDSEKWLVKPMGNTAGLTVVGLTTQLGADWEFRFYAGLNGTGGAVSGTTNMTVTDRDENLDRYRIATIPSGARSFVLGHNIAWAGGTAGLDRGNIYGLNCNSNDVITICFINKYGVLDYLYFVGRHTDSYSVERKSFERSTLISGTYTTTRHAKKNYEFDAIQRKTINSGLYPEGYNEMFKQLLLSEYVWWNDGGTYNPVNILNSDMEYKTSQFDKMINYTMEIEFSHKAINNIK